MKKDLARRTNPEDVRDWSQHKGRHAYDGYLEDVMSVHVQGVDPADDRSARVFVKGGKIVLVSTDPKTIAQIVRAMQRGHDIVGKQAKRPDGDTLEQMLRDSPFSRGLPPPSQPAKALTRGEQVIDAAADDQDDEEDIDADEEDNDNDPDEPEDEAVRPSVHRPTTGRRVNRG